MNYDTLSIQELRHLIAEAGLTIKSRSKAPLIAALIANAAQTPVRQQEKTPLNIYEKRARLEEINNLLDGRTKLAPEQEMPLLYEAMQLCEDLGLDRAWHRFKAFSERLNRASFEQKQIQQQEEVQHEALAVVDPVVENSRERAEMLIVEMDAVQVELQQTSDYKLFESCKLSLEALKAEIVALGYEVKRVPTGWALIEPVVEEVAQVASTPTLHEDEQGLYASVPSSTGKTAYTVRVCARWLYTVSCNCPSRVDCTHRLELDRALDTVRPTFSEQVKGVVASREVIARLVRTPDRYAQPLKGSGVTGFRHAEIARKLAA